MALASSVILALAPLQAADQNAVIDPPDADIATLEADFVTLIEAARAQAPELDFTLLRNTWAEHEDFNPYLRESDLYQNALRELVVDIGGQRYRSAAERCEADSPRFQMDLLWSLRCRDAYVGLDDSEAVAFYDYMIGGLTRSIMSSGDGESPDTAYEVITLAEQYAVFAILGVEKVEQSLLEQGGHVYDRIVVQGDAAQGDRVLFFRVDAVFRWLNRAH